MKSAMVGSVKPKVMEGVSSPRKKEVFGISPQKVFQGSSRKGKGPLKPEQKPIKCYRCDDLGPRVERMSHSGKLKLEGTSGSWSFLNSWKSWLHSYTNPKSKSMTYKLLQQSDLNHNPDSLYRLVEQVNETTVLVEGQEARVLIDSGSQLSSISLAWVKKLNLNPQQLQSVLQIEGSWGLDIPYLGYVKLTLESLRLRLLMLMFSY